MDIKQTIREQGAAGLQAHYDLSLAPAELQVQETDKQHQGDFTLVVFPLLRYKLGQPEEVGQTLGNYIQAAIPQIANFEVVKGFVNFELSAQFWLAFLRESEAAGPAYFRTPQNQGSTVMVEFSSPNTNKPLHLGHLRNIFLGDAISRLLEATGAEVVRANLINDRGIHIAKSMVAYQKFGQGETPQTAAKKGDHLVGDYYVLFDRYYRQQVSDLTEKGYSEEEAAKVAPLQQEAAEMHRRWEAGDEDVLALWRKMNGWVYEGFEATYQQLGVQFDQYYYESDTYLLGRDIVQEGLDRGIFYTAADGAVWVDLQDEGLDQKLLLRSDGTSIYITQDLGTAEKKFTDYPSLERSLYVIGNEQDYHMTVLRLIMQKLGRPWAEGIQHISYGMVDLPTGKMKSREGTVVDADDLLAEMEREAQVRTEAFGKTEGLGQEELQRLYAMLGLGALKYFLLKVDAHKRMLFDPEASIDFKGDTGVFIQYGHARINSLLTKAEQRGLSAALPDQLPALQDSEEAILKVLYRFPEVLADAAHSYNPSLITNWAFELTREANRFLYEIPVLRAEGEAQLGFRLGLMRFTRQAIQQSMRLIGIQVPARM